MRRSRDSGSHFDSFPFLNIMLGMIVVLVLFLLIISTRATDQQLRAVPPVGPGPGPLPRPRHDSAGMNDADLTDEQFSQFSTQLADLKTKVDERRKQIAQLRKQRAELESRLQVLEDAALEASHGDGVGESGYMVGKPDPTIMRPDTKFQKTKLPRFITVEADAYTFHHDDRATRHRAEELDAKSSPLEKFLAEASNRREKEYLLLLVKPNGAEEFVKLREKITKLAQSGATGKLRGIPLDIGWEPFADQWLLWDGESQKAK